MLLAENACVKSHDEAIYEKNAEAETKLKRDALNMN
jgi:hypothetical protein